MWNDVSIEEHNELHQKFLEGKKSKEWSTLSDIWKQCFQDQMFMKSMIKLQLQDVKDNQKDKIFTDLGPILTWRLLDSNFVFRVEDRTSNAWVLNAKEGPWSWEKRYAYNKKSLGDLIKEWQDGLKIQKAVEDEIKNKIIQLKPDEQKSILNNSRNTDRIIWENLLSKIWKWKETYSDPCDMCVFANNPVSQEHIDSYRKMINEYSTYTLIDDDTQK